MGPEAASILERNPSSGELRITHEEPFRVGSLNLDPFRSHLIRPLFPRDGVSVILARGTGSNYQPARFSLESGELIRFYDRAYGNPYRGLTLATDSRQDDAGEELYVCQGPVILPLSDRDQGKQREWRADNLVLDLAAPPDGGAIIAATADGAALRWARHASSQSTPVEVAFQTHQRDALAISPNGLLLAAAQHDGLVQVCHLRDQDGIPDLYFPIALVPAKDKGSLPPRFWSHRWKGVEPERGDRPMALPSTRILVNCDGTIGVPIAHNNRANHLMATGAWSLLEGNLMARGFSTGGLIMCGAFSPIDPDQFVTALLAGPAGELARWSARSGNEIGARIALPAAPRDVAFRPDGQQLAVVCGNGEVVTINLGSAECSPRQIQESIRFKANNEYINSGRIAYSPDGALLFSWSIDGTVRCWDPETGANRYAIEFEFEEVRTQRDVLFVPGGYLCTGGQEALVQWWYVEDGSPAPFPSLRHPDTVHDLLLSSDGRYLITCCRDGAVRVWDWREGSLLSLFDHGDEVFCAALTSRGNVVSGGENKALQVWDPRTGRALSPELQAGEIRSIEVVRHGDREMVLAGVAEGGVFGFELSRYRNHVSLSTAQCLDLGEVMSGRRITANGSSQRLTPEEWGFRWNRLSDQQRAFLRESFPVNPPAWHRWKSDHPEEKAIRDWHRERLREINPRVTGELDQVEERRVSAAAAAAKWRAAQADLKAGEQLARTSQWAEARRHFETAMEAAGDLVAPSDLGNFALVLYKLGETDAYFQVCEDYVRRFQLSDDPWELRLASRLYFGLPSAPDDPLPNQVLGMARRSIEGSDEESSDYPFGALALGLAEYRTGDAAKAVEWLEIAQEGPEFCRIPAHAYRALAAARLGRTEDASEHLKKAEEHAARLLPIKSRSSNWKGVVLSEMALEEARSVLAVGISD